MANATATKTEKTVKITLPLLSGKNVSQSVFVAVNFAAYKIKRGVAVEVPASVAAALEEAQRATDAEIRARNARAFRSPSAM